MLGNFLGGNMVDIIKSLFMNTGVEVEGLIASFVLTIILGER